MALIPQVSLADLQQARSIIDEDKRPTPELLRLLNGNTRNLRRVLLALIDVIEQQQIQLNQIIAVTKRDKRTASHTEPTAVLTTTDDGASATIAVINHRRVYTDGSFVDIIGGSQAELASGTVWAGYYDDPTLADTTPTFVFTQAIEQAQFAAADGRHPLGVITTPAAASGGTFTGGGTYPPGSSVGGEIP